MPGTWPRACAALIEREACYQNEIDKQILQCDAEARTAEKVKDAAKEATIDNAVKKYGGGQPAVDAKNEIKNKIEKVEDVRSLITRAYNYQKLSDNEKLDLSRNMTKKLNSLRDRKDSSLSEKLSKDLTDLSIDGVIKTNKAALEKLDRDLKKIVDDQRALANQKMPVLGPDPATRQQDELSRAIEEAKKESAQTYKDRLGIRNHVDEMIRKDREDVAEADRQNQAERERRRRIYEAQMREWQRRRSSGSSKNSRRASAWRFLVLLLL